MINVNKVQENPSKRPKVIWSLPSFCSFELKREFFISYSLFHIHGWIIVLIHILLACDHALINMVFLAWACLSKVLVLYQFPGSWGTAMFLHLSSIHYQRHYLFIKGGLTEAFGLPIYLGRFWSLILSSEFRIHVIVQKSPFPLPQSLNRMSFTSNTTASTSILWHQSTRQVLRIKWHAAPMYTCSEKFLDLWPK